jgi:uncharacterized protein
MTVATNCAATGGAIEKQILDGKVAFSYELTNADTYAYVSEPVATVEFDGFDWDNGNREKCQKHGLPIAEIESLFGRPVVILPDKENNSGERRYRALGTTKTGRRAFVVFTLRDRGGAVRLRPISARYMHMKEVANHEKNYPDV